ncbi:MAG: prolipoprotein diacylglyceryl transferase [Hyphomicrobiales bacterium]|nr:MAG: prolipoprotein diacylglyceryl transferase [Hyphomicrobiales bacterium]
MPTAILPYPAIDPVLIEIGPLALRWYALAYIAGIMIGWWYARRLVMNDRLWGAVKRPTVLQIDDFVLWATIGIVFGGRLGYVLLYKPAYYAANPLDIVKVWEGGMAFHGGILGVTVAMTLFSRLRGLTAWTLFDVISAVVPIGLFFGRIANFVNAELYGRPSDVSWAMVFPTDPLGLPRHPSQLYEAALEGLLLFAFLAVLTHMLLRFRRPGFVTGAFVAGYGVARIVAELFRMPDDHLGFLAGALTMGMVLSIPMVIVGAAVMFFAARRGGQS